METKSIALILALVCLTRSQDAPQQQARHCSVAGNTCSTCGTVAVCVGTGDGGFQPLLQDCAKDESCVAGQCVQGALCNYRPFQCLDEGYYPDPYDCRRYHVCLPGSGGTLSPLSFDCPEGNSYNASSQDCSATICLDRPVPECINKLQIGAVPNDSNLYYICIERENTLAPELRRCPGGRVFDSGAVSCVDSSSSSSSSSEQKKDKKKKKS